LINLYIKLFLGLVFLVACLVASWTTQSVFKGAIQREIATFQEEGRPASFLELAPLSPEGRRGAAAYRILLEKHQGILDFRKKPCKELYELAVQPTLSDADWKRVKIGMAKMDPLLADLRVIFRDQKAFQLFKAEEYVKNPFTYKFEYWAPLPIVCMV
ncbi:MAG: hypothetical protein AAB303_03420, partial [Chloroflexota bacterium]